MPVKWMARFAAAAARNPKDTSKNLLKIVFVVLFVFMIIGTVSFHPIASFTEQNDLMNDEFDITETEIYRNLDKLHNAYLKKVRETETLIEEKIIEVNTYYVTEERTETSYEGVEITVPVQVPKCDVSIAKTANRINFSYFLAYINYTTDVIYNKKYNLDERAVNQYMLEISILQVRYGGKIYIVDIFDPNDFLKSIEERGPLEKNKSAAIENVILTPQKTADKFFPDIYENQEFLLSYELYKDFLDYIEDGEAELDFDTPGDAYTSLPEGIIEELELEEDGVGIQVVKWALTKLGVPYSQQYRDTGRYYDCSSLTYYAYRSAGITLTYRGANTAAAQAQYFYTSGKTVSVNNLKPGDLIFYSFKENGRFMNVTHVAIYAGKGKVIDASSSKGYVVYRNIYRKNDIVLCGRY